MCTVTWLRSEAEYTLFFNRDELLVRKGAHPARVHEKQGVRFLAPTDGDFGGCWILVNERGLTLGILNGYRSADVPDPGDCRSRGLLLVDLAPASGVAEVEERLRAIDADRYRSFRLVALEPRAPVWVAEWDRVRVEIDRNAEGRLPLISSSFEETEVGRRRREVFSSTVGDVPSLNLLEAFHKSHAHGPSPYSVCMHRPNASTRSLTRVDVSPGEVRLDYHDGPPCEATEPATVRLARIESSQESTRKREALPPIPTKRRDG